MNTNLAIGILAIVSWTLLLAVVLLVIWTRRSTPQKVFAFVAFSRSAEIQKTRQQIEMSHVSLTKRGTVIRVLSGTTLSATILGMIAIFYPDLRLTNVLLILVLLPCPAIVACINRWFAVIAEKLDQLAR